MATIRCWALHGNVQNAINYIINPEKTDNGLLVETKGSRSAIAGTYWKAKDLHNEFDVESDDKKNIVGYHFQQSWEAGSITPEEALELSKEWIEKITGGQHDYVLSVHVDQADRQKNPHIHTHIVVNPRNNVTGNKMQLFYKRDIPTFKEISDRICVEHGQNVLSQPKGRGKTYYEWMMENQGDDLKNVIAKTIDTIIPKVRDYNEFKEYLIKLGYEVEDGLKNEISDYFECTADISLINETLSTDTNYFIRIPKTNDYLSIPKKAGKWENNDRTFRIKFKNEDTLVRYDSSGSVKSKIEAIDLKTYFEDKTEEKGNRQGLRIKPPYAKKFIRCHRIEENELHQGYSLNQVLDRIEDNECYATDPLVEEFLHGNQNRTEALNSFYEEANIKTKWTNSKYYKMSKKERYVEFKTNELQQRLNNIHERRVSASDIMNVDDLKTIRQSLSNDLKNIYGELSKQEAYFEQIQLDRLADRLEMTDAELDDYIDTNIVPLRNLKQSLKNEIRDTTTRIETAEKKIKQAAKEEKRR